MSRDAETVLTEATPRQERVADILRDGADWFHDHEGKLFERSEALDTLTDELDCSRRTAGAVLAELTGDTVDPIVQIRSDEAQYYGIVEYVEFDDAYGYIEYDDITGEHKRVVCAQCVHDVDVDTAVAHATAGDPSGQFGDQPNADYDELHQAVREHYTAAHRTTPDTVETGANLASDTTIGGNKSWHAGNDGSNSGLNADTLDGNDSSHFLASADYNPESDTHVKTTSASELTDVSADSASDAHHSRYADSEAVSAVESASSVSLTGDLSISGGLTTGQPVTHSTDITSEFTVPSGEGIVLAGPISGESNITGSGNVAVVDPDSDSITTESDVLNAVNTDSTHSADAYHSHTDLVDISSDAHHTKTTSASALTDVSADSVSDAHHSRYTDSEAQSAADGSIDAESVDGYDIQKNGTDGQGIINFKT